MFRQIGPTEIILILLVVVLLFGAKKLPETARGLGRSLRIFKAETKAMKDDDEPDMLAPETRQVEARSETSTTQGTPEPSRDAVGEGTGDPSGRNA
ncbi:MAG: Sec-independent protein translocase subunit TatA [Jiangellaceae bacterium]